jgi:hypothetical protein
MTEEAQQRSEVDRVISRKWRYSDYIKVDNVRHVREMC